MIEAVRAIECVALVSGSNDKMQVLKHYATTPGLKEILRFIYNPYHKTGISNAKLDKALQQYADSTTAYYDVTYLDIIKYLSEHNTGSSFDVACASGFIKQVSRQYPGDRWAVKVARAIVTQNLQIGVTATTLNKVFGANFIPKIGCILGTSIKEIPANKLKWPYIVTEKLDGNRRMIVRDSTGTITAYTRSGHIDTGLIDICKDMAHLPKGYMYDGELLAIGAFKDSIALRQATASIANSKGVKTGLTFNIFDMVKEVDFFNGVSSDGALDRKIRLAATLMDESLSMLITDWYSTIQALGIHKQLTYVKPVPILGVARNMSEVEELVAPIWKRGYEGVMLNTMHGLYKVSSSRSKELLKVKKTDEYVLPVVDVLEGNNKYEDMLGSLVVLYKGNYVGVGSGFTDTQRTVLWEKRDELIGRHIEIESFGESTNAGGSVSLNCPIFLRFADEEHE